MGKLSLWLSGEEKADNWADDKKEQSYFSLKGMVESIFIKLGLIQQLQQKSISNDTLEDGTSLFVGKKEVGTIGWVNKNILKTFGIKQKVFFADLNWGEIVALYYMNKVSFKPLPKTQFVRRDFSLLLDDQVTFEQIEAIARKADRKILKEVGLFDVYEGKNLEKGKKSYAVNFIFQDQELTLKDSVVDKIMDKIKKGLEEELKAELR